jgi:hypothetical protein
LRLPGSLTQLSRSGAVVAVLASCAMKRLPVAVVAGSMLTVALAGCGSPAPDAAACTRAMARQYTAAAGSPNWDDTSPAVCKGLPAGQVRRIAAEIIVKNLRF